MLTINADCTVIYRYPARKCTKLQMKYIMGYTVVNEVTSRQPNQKLALFPFQTHLLNFSSILFSLTETTIPCHAFCASPFSFEAHLVPVRQVYKSQCKVFAQMTAFNWVSKALFTPGWLSALFSPIAKEKKIGQRPFFQTTSLARLGAAQMTACAPAVRMASSCGAPTSESGPKLCIE